MNLFSLASLSLSITCFLLAIFILYLSRQSLHRIWAFFNFAVGVYGLGMFLAGSAKSYDSAFLYWKIALFGVANISLFFYWMVYKFCKLKNKKTLYFAIIHSTIFSFLTLTTKWIVNDLKFVFNQFYFTIAGIGWDIFFTIWIAIVVKAFIELFYYIKGSKGIVAVQGNYLFYGMLLGFISGAATSVLSWGINIYPVWHFFVCVYAAISTYAILRYQLLDIKIVFTRLGVFIAVYSLVLGFPFWLSWKMLGFGKWLIPATIGTFLASLGPFIYLYLQRRAESRILRDQRRVHDVIKKASAGMVGIREMSKLLRVLVNVLKENLHLENISVYLFDPEHNNYVLKASKPEMENRVIHNDHALFSRLKSTKYPVSLDEIEHLQANSKSPSGHLEEIINQMQDLQASIIIPAVKKDEKLEEDVLLAFIVLGKRQGKEVFSSEDLDLLRVVGNEFALSIEIILSLIERDKLLNENFEIRRFESLGLLCNSMSHQMNNRFQGIVNLLLNPLDIFSEGKYKECPKEELIALLEEFAHSSKRIDEISKEGGKLTRDILNFSRGKMEFGVVNFEDMVTKSLNFLEQKHIRFKYELRKEYPKDVLLWGSELGIKDLIYNAVDNSCFSMQSKQEQGADYIPAVTIRGKLNGSMFYFEIEDNGMGIKKDDVRKVMDPMFTTKGHNKGFGMGTTFMQQIVQKHGGTIVYESEWEKWARVKISLPLATKEQRGQ